MFGSESLESTSLVGDIQYQPGGCGDDPTLEPSSGAGTYAVMGLVGLIAGAAFLQNVLPLGTPRNLLSGGTIPVINVAVGIEVTAAFVLLAIEFFKEAEKSERGEH
jgi:multicomponent Na+:H+ antiporter subunit B